MIVHGRMLAAVSATGCALVLPGCGGGSSSPGKHGSSTSTRSTATATAPTTTSAPVPVPAAAPLAPLDTAQDVTASSSRGGGPKTVLKVSASRYIRKLTPRFLQAPKLKGSRYVGVQLTLINVGQAAWSGSPARAAVLITDHNAQAPKVPAVGRCGGPFGSKVELLRGERQSGCLAFILNSGERPDHLQFSPDSPATPPVEWSLRPRT
jgi:hypothetical protein